jgi:hypothetical protein
MSLFNYMEKIFPPWNRFYLVIVIGEMTMTYFRYSFAQLI